MVKLDRYIGTSVFFSILAVLGIIVSLALLFAFIDELGDVEAGVGGDQRAHAAFRLAVDGAHLRLARFGGHVDGPRLWPRDGGPIFRRARQRLMMAGALTEHRIKPQRQKGRDHRKNYDVEHRTSAGSSPNIGVLRHSFKCPAKQDGRSLN